MPLAEEIVQVNFEQQSFRKGAGWLSLRWCLPCLLGFLAFLFSFPLDRQISLWPYLSIAEIVVMWFGLITPVTTLKLAGRGEEQLNSCSVQPRPRARLSQKLNQTTPPATTHEASQMCRVLRQGVQQMSQSHQEVVTLHGLPVLRKAMLVLIALTLLHQKVAFD